VANCSDTKLRKGAYRLALPAGEANPKAVRSFMRECLVPLLAEEFLRRRDTTIPLELMTKPQKPTTELPDE
jgi:hypothetical protein